MMNNVLELHKLIGKGGTVPEPPIINPVWERPTDWIDISNCPLGAINLLFANTGHRMCRFTASSSLTQYQVDWGDGNVEIFNNGVIAKHIYSPSAGTDCSEGYKTVKITITGVGGDVNFFKANPYEAMLPSSTNNILWAVFNSPSILSLTDTFGRESSNFNYNYYICTNWIIFNHCIENSIFMNFKKIAGDRIDNLNNLYFF